MKIFNYSISLACFFLFSITGVTTNKVQAQDIHFSMFYASPLNLNPALTGINECTYRAAGIYRNQWRSVSSPTVFATYSASFDIKLLQAKLPNDIFGVGGMFVGDRSGGGRISMNSGMVSAAYHKGLDKNHRHFLGLGVQLGYTQKSLKWQQLTFPNQFDDGTGDFTNHSDDEVFAKPQVGYFDMQAGILHQSTFNDRIAMMTGFSVYHLVMPNESFMGNKKMKLPFRFTVHEGLRIKLIKNLYITPNFIFQYQNKAKEINFGTAFEYRMPVAKTEVAVSLGGWYRVSGNDAAVISAGVEAFRTKLMFAYDINVSTLTAASNNRGAFELALIFTGCLNQKKMNYPILVPCPMM